MSAQERAYARLRNDLRELRIKPDTRLNIGETAEALGVSTIPLREAMARLAAEGLLERVAGNGFRAPPLSVANVEGDFTVVFAFFAHVVDRRFRDADAASFIIERTEIANDRLRDMRGHPDQMADEAEEYVRSLLPVLRSAKFRSCVEAALDSSTVYRRVHYREILDYDTYLVVREKFLQALKQDDEAVSREMVVVAQRSWEDVVRELCRYAWVELFDDPAPNADAFGGS